MKKIPKGNAIAALNAEGDVEIKEAEWERLKQQGSEHYRTAGVQPIDLYRDTVPHESLSVFAVKALSDCIKYAHRQLTRGYLETDTEKMIHYLQLLKAAGKE